MGKIEPVKQGQRTIDLLLRTVAKPEKNVAVLLSHLGIKLPKGSKAVQNAVEKTPNLLCKPLIYNRLLYLTAELGLKPKIPAYSKNTSETENNPG